MTPTLLLVLLSVIGLALFVTGAGMMVNRQEGGGGRRPALFMIAGLAAIVLGLMSALVVKWAETPPDAGPHDEIAAPGR